MPELLRPDECIMPRQQKNVRLPALTIRELNWLKTQYGMSESEVIILAIDTLYHRREEVTPIPRDCGKELVKDIIEDHAVLDHD